MGKNHPYYGKSMSTNFPDSPHTMGFVAFSHTMGHWQGNPYISHMMKYTIGWESNGKKAPMLWEKHEYQFPRHSSYHGFCCIFLYCGKFLGKSAKSKTQKSWKPRKSSKKQLNKGITNSAKKKKLKKKDFLWFQVFVLSPMFKNKNSKITVILQNSHNTKISECSFKKQLRCSSNHRNLKIIQPYSQSGTRYLPFMSF